MIYCNLAVLLAERNLKISKVASDTGISRTTLTALCQNTGKGVQTDTIDSLCMYLNIEVGDLYSFIPFNIEVSNCEYFDDNNTADIVFEYISKQYSGKIHCSAEIEINSFKLPERGCSAFIRLLEYEPTNPIDEYTNKILRESFRMLPQAVIFSLQSKIANITIKEIINHVNVEIDGDVYGYPEDMELWDIDVNLPKDWR